jgi:archaellin
MGHEKLAVLAAFVLIAAIVAAPLLQRVWWPEVVIAQR